MSLISVTFSLKFVDGACDLSKGQWREDSAMVEIMVDYLDEIVDTCT